MIMLLVSVRLRLEGKSGGFGGILEAFRHVKSMRYQRLKASDRGVKKGVKMVPDH